MSEKVVVRLDFPDGGIPVKDFLEFLDSVELSDLVKPAPTPEPDEDE